MNPFGFSSEVIRSKDNPSVKLFRKLMNSKKERQSCGLFVLEGSRLVFDALKENAPVMRIFITESAAEGHVGEKLSELCDDIDVTVVSDELGDKMSGTDKTQGIFAQCRLPRESGIFRMKKGGRYIVLYQLQDPGNAGMIIRTADAVGMDGVIFCSSCDIYSPKTIRSTMGSIFRVPVCANAALDDIFTGAGNAGLETFAAVVDGSACDLKKVSFESGGVIFIGNEGNGLPDEVSAMCSERITIKMNGNIDSLNAAMAAGIMMWELTGND
ncbi:MAG: TrmH family RNA methyltransferase [Porcipelethomonas sp.]